VKERDRVRKTTAALGSLTFFLVAPCVVAGVVPWWLTGWRVRAPLPHWAPLRVLGVMLLAAGVTVLVHAFVRFVVEGIGTPAPIAPTQRLVVGGLYRHVRNPMYLALVATIVGQALALGQPTLLWYAAVVAVATAAFARGYEEPTLRRRFGAEYDAYHAAVPGWWPRWHPWHPAERRER
jgi:protein-S-isoprenylcysteine O-methyltransferase Ste14